MRSRVAAAALFGLMIAAFPAQAQFSDSYNFLKAVRDKDALKAQTIVTQPGSRIINTRDPQTGEMAMHIVTRRRDLGWMGFLLNAGAEVDARDRSGNTPLLIASGTNFPDGVKLLLAVKADPNASNDQGETPLIKAVQARDTGAVRLLLDAGADPAISDHVAGLSARDYAEQDRHGTAILRLLENAAVKPKPGGMMGPRLGGG